MQKIIALVKRGWQVSIVSESQGWFSVGFSHNTWGDAEGYDETLAGAISKAYDEAKKLESEGWW